MKKTIMVVDDEYLIMETVREILVKSGYKVITALSGAEALKKSKKQKVDLFLLDIMMPGMGGLEVTKRIRRDKKLLNVKIAYLTVISFTDLQKYKLKKYNISDYIQKPFENRELINKINRIMEA